MADKRKLVWTERHTDAFIKACVVEVQRGNRPTTHLNKQAYTSLTEKMTMIFGRPIDHKHLKNKWDSLRKDWTLWHKLKDTTGLGWNTVKGTVEAPHEWWEEKIKETPAIGKFRDRGLFLPEDMAVLFGSNVATGEFAYDPAPEIAPERVATSDTWDDFDLPMSPPPSQPVAESSSRPVGGSQLRKKAVISKKRRPDPSELQRLSEAMTTCSSALQDATTALLKILNDTYSADSPEFMDLLVFFASHPEERRIVISLGAYGEQVLRRFLERMLVEARRGK